MLLSNWIVKKEPVLRYNKLNSIVIVKSKNVTVIFKI